MYIVSTSFIVRLRFVGYATIRAPLEAGSLSLKWRISESFLFPIIILAINVICEDDLLFKLYVVQRTLKNKLSLPKHLIQNFPANNLRLKMIVIDWSPPKLIGKSVISSYFNLWFWFRVAFFHCYFLYFFLLYWAFKNITDDVIIFERFMSIQVLFTFSSSLWILQWGFLPPYARTLNFLQFSLYCVYSFIENKL